MAKRGKRAARRRTGSVRPRSGVVLLLAAIALVAQLVALPYHHPQPQSELTAVAADLQATFGDAARLCAQTDDRTSPAPAPRSGDCNPVCPLCQFAAQAFLIDAPPPTLPERLAISNDAPPARVDFLGPRVGRIRFAQPRAPPVSA